MSEHLKKLKELEFEKELLTRKLHETRRVSKALPESSKLKGDIALFENRLAEARKEEQQIKERLRLVGEEKKRLIDDTIHMLEGLADEETHAEEDYRKKARSSELTTVSQILTFIANDEFKHQQQLRTLIKELKSMSI